MGIHCFTPINGNITCKSVSFSALSRDRNSSSAPEHNLESSASRATVATAKKTEEQKRRLKIVSGFAMGKTQFTENTDFFVGKFQVFRVKTGIPELKVI